MASLATVILVVVFASYAIATYHPWGAPKAFKNDSVHIKEFTPSHPNQYVCTAKKLDSGTSYYLRGFEPSDKLGAAHHILLYGCQKPGAHDDIWSCGEMAGDENKSLKKAGVCGAGGTSSILFAEAMQAGSYALPDNVSFKVGKGSPYKYLVIQIHYGKVDQFIEDPDKKDFSGIEFKYQTNPTKNLGGVYLIGSDGLIPKDRFKGDVETLDVICRGDRPKTIVPFAFRTHAHNYGTVITGFRVEERLGNDYWSLIGLMSPQLEQTFYPVKTKMEISKSDTIAVRCSYSNPTKDTVYIGPTMADEMCNFYIMYYTEDGNPLQKGSCFGDGGQHWEDEFRCQIPGKVQDDSWYLSDKMAEEVEENKAMKAEMAHGKDNM